MFPSVLRLNSPIQPYSGGFRIVISSAPYLNMPSMRNLNQQCCFYIESSLRARMQGNTLESRRQLRSDLESESLRLAREFISEFSEIEQVYSCVCAGLRSCNLLSGSVGRTRLHVLLFALSSSLSVAPSLSLFLSVAPSLSLPLSVAPTLSLSLCRSLSLSLPPYLSPLPLSTCLYVCACVRL